MTLILIFTVIGFTLWITRGKNKPIYPDEKGGPGMYNRYLDVRLSEEHENLSEAELKKSLNTLKWLKDNEKDY
jgi:hypothetical protein